MIYFRENSSGNKAHHNINLVIVSSDQLKSKNPMPDINFQCEANQSVLQRWLDRLVLLIDSNAPWDLNYKEETINGIESYCVWK